MPSYPSSVFSATSKNQGDTVHNTHVNDLDAEVNAIEEALVGATGITHTIKSRLGTLTSNKTFLDLGATWNNAGVTFGGILLNVTDTASAAASLLLDLQVGGGSKFKVDKLGGGFYARNILNTGTITTSQPALDIVQTWNAGAVAFTGILANVTDTASTAASQLLELQVAAIRKFAVEKSGVVRGDTYLALSAGSAGNPRYSFDLDPNTGVYNIAPDILLFATAGVERLRIDAAGHLLFGTDNAQDIGASGATRPRDIYFGGAIKGLSVVDKKPKALYGTTWTASANIGSFVAASVNDANLSVAAFHVDTAGVGEWVKLDLGVGITKDFVGLDIVPATGTVVFFQFEVEYSDDDSAWTVVVNSAGDNVRQIRRIEWRSSGAHRYWRLRKINSATAGGSISEIQFYEAR